MKFKVLEHIHHACKTVNEDLFDHVDKAAWILDGASGIGPNIIPGAPSDPFWLVHTVSKLLRQGFVQGGLTDDILKKTAHSLMAEFSDNSVSPVPALIDRPTACLMFARIVRDEIELFTAGDCQALVRNREGVVSFGVKIGHASQEVWTEFHKLVGENVPAAEFRERLLPFERRFRAKANIPSGYSIVDTSTRWPEFMTRSRIAVKEGDQVLLMTDGLYRLVDTVQAYSNESLFDYIIGSGLDAAYQELRQIEAADADCRKFPRIKPTDDVAAALLTLELD